MDIWNNLKFKRKREIKKKIVHFTKNYFLINLPIRIKNKNFLPSNVNLKIKFHKASWDYEVN